MTRWAAELHVPANCRHCVRSGSCGTADRHQRQDPCAMRVSHISLTARTDRDCLPHPVCVYPMIETLRIPHGRFCQPVHSVVQNALPDLS